MFPFFPSSLREDFFFSISICFSFGHRGWQGLSWTTTGTGTNKIFKNDYVNGQKGGPKRGSIAHQPFVVGFSGTKKKTNKIQEKKPRYSHESHRSSWSYIFFSWFSDRISSISFKSLVWLYRLGGVPYYWILLGWTRFQSAIPISCSQPSRIYRVGGTLSTLILSKLIESTPNWIIHNWPRT